MTINETGACKQLDDLVLAESMPLSEQFLRLFQAQHDEPQAARLKSSVISDGLNQFEADA